MESILDEIYQGIRENRLEICWAGKSSVRVGIGRGQGKVWSREMLRVKGGKIFR